MISHQIVHQDLPLWKLLLITHNKPDKPFHPTVNDCIELIEFDAQLLANGDRLDDIRSDLDYHLKLCAPYKEQLEDLLGKLVEYMEAQENN